MEQRGTNQAKSLSGTIRRSPLATGSGGNHNPKELMDRKYFFKNRSKLIAAIGVVVAVGLVIWAVFLRPNLLIERGKYQALFLTNGEAYFGKLQDTGFEYMILNDVYYIQSNAAKSPANESSGQSSASDGGQSQLVKLGKETHGPTDRMIIRKENVSYFENLKSDGQVVKLIEQDKAK